MNSGQCHVTQHAQRTTDRLFCPLSFCARARRQRFSVTILMFSSLAFSFSSSLFLLSLEVEIVLPILKLSIMNSPPSKSVLILPEEQEGSGSGHHRSSGRRTSTDTAFYTCPPLPDQFCARREFQNEFGGTRGTTRLALSDFFDHGKSLGEGGFGSVVLCEELSTKFRCVIKKVDRSTVIEDGMAQILAQEIESMHKLQQHPNIVQLVSQIGFHHMIHSLYDVDSSS